MTRLSRDDWTAAAVIIMASKGIASVKVEPLARSLDVSKGSFYWHFENRDDLLESVATRWERDTRQLIKDASKAGQGIAKLQALFMLIGEQSSSEAGVAADSAMFLWAQSEPRIKRRVLKVERERVAFLADVIQESGIPQDVATERATLSYLSFIGYQSRASRVKSYATAKAFSRFSAQLIEQMFRPPG